MNTEHLKEMKSNDDIRKNLAKWLVNYCFRNSKLENFHDCTGANTNTIIDLLKDGDNLKTQQWNDWDDPVFRDDIHQSSLHLFNVLQEARRSSS
jgi:hypothetical protein